MTARESRATNKLIDAEVDQHIERFIATGKTIENLRDIWYAIKGDIEHLYPSCTREIKKTKVVVPLTYTAWDGRVNKRIGAKLYNLFLAGDIDIYTRLNIISSALTNTEYKFNTPIVLFSEKKTRALENAMSSLLCGRFSSTGQIPSFEVVKIAEYLARTAIDDTAYLVSITDYDPSGDNIFNALVKKVEEALQLIDSDIVLFSANVSYGDDHDSIISKYDFFTLESNSINNKWICEDRLHGVELNVIYDKQEKLEDLIVEFVSPTVLEQLSFERARIEKLEQLKTEDEEYQQLLLQLQIRETELSKKVDELNIDFTSELHTVSSDAVTGMTKFYE